MSAPEIIYREDILKEGFEQVSIDQPDDYEGKVTVTLIRKRNTTASSKAVLYVHGFSDYFFQKEMAEEFIAHGYNFYAVDLRKYGRSILPNQKPNNLRDLTEYYADLDAALSIIKAEGNATVLLSGHSTGGLIVTLYATARMGKELFDCLFCNSPFYDMNMPNYQKKNIIPMVARIGKKFPNLSVSGGFSEFYGKALHKNDFGEWDYNLSWKPHIAAAVNAGWVNAIYQGHLKIGAGITIGKPILILHSGKSVYPKKWSEELFEGDAILNVNDIRAKSELIVAPKKTIIAIDEALHDMILSRKPVRTKVFEIVFHWLEKNGN